jgi:hypothetical protein
LREILAGLISAVMKKPRKRSLVSELLGFTGRHIPDPDVLKARLQERDQRLAADTRTELQKWLGDPPPDRSALARSGAAMPRWIYHQTRRRQKGWL